MNPVTYYDIEAEEVDIFGGLREVFLGDTILSQIQKTTRSFIDIGCGDGYVLYRTLTSKKHYITTAHGLDLSQKRLQKTKNHAQNSVLTQGSIFNLPFKDNSFDTVVCSETLEHLENYQQALLELIRITKKQLIITVPNEEPVALERCPQCQHHFYINDHCNSFEARALTKIIHNLANNIIIHRVIKFHTIFSYNKTTLKWPTTRRILLDRILVFLSKKIPFFKPNYLLISVRKIR